MSKTNRKTKIIATIGPASKDYQTLVKLYKAGANAFRLNFSHGTYKEHREVIRNTQKLNKELNAHVSIIADLQGPKLRVGKMENEGVKLVRNSVIEITTEKCIGNSTRIQVGYKNLPKDIRIGDKILLDDGNIELRVTETDKASTVKAKVIQGGLLTSNKGFNLPDTPVSSPALTEKDKKDLEFIMTQDINWVALSFVRSPRSIYALRERLNEKAPHIKVISKIEKPEAIKNLESIVKASDGVMIARGDLGVEMPMEQIPLLQKAIINISNRNAKPVIIATQMMESMIETARPTRAEITDTANGVLDGADALMLSAETAVGKFPVSVVKTIDRIIRHTEKESGIYHMAYVPHKGSPTFLSDAICFNACKISEDVNARAIIGMTHSGSTAFKVSSNRPKAEIFIFTNNRKLLNTLSILWGVKVFFYDKYVSTDETINDVLEILKQQKLIRPGDIIVNTASIPIKERGRTNMIKISYIR